VAPGLVDTPWTADWDLRARVRHRPGPAATDGHSEDVAEVILGLARSAYVTGEVVLVDGGLNLR
jgi:ketoreductase RED2